MTKDEQVQYLANIYHLLRSDGGTDEIEDKVLQQIVRDIGGGYFERRNAQELVGQPTFEIRPVGRLSERLRNLEDMVFAGYSNGMVDATEKKIIVEFATAIAVNQQQFSMIKSEAKRRRDDFL